MMVEKTVRETKCGRMCEGDKYNSLEWSVQASQKRESLTRNVLTMKVRPTQTADGKALQVQGNSQCRRNMRMPRAVD